MFQRNFRKFLLFVLVLSAFSCQRAVVDNNRTVAPQTLRDVPALRLNYRFEPDVPAPPATNQTAQSEERNAAAQNNFDQNRPQELLDKTITSPNQQRFLAVYHKTEDSQGDFRLDMYSADGKLLQKITHDGMAVHYPDTIVWSPDSGNIAFMAKTRVGQGNNPSPQATPNQTENNANVASNPEANNNTETNTNGANTNAPPANAVTEGESPKAVLTFRTEQIYTADANGNDVKPLTQNEGLIYFYFVWSPNGSMLVSLAATYQEWNFLQYQAENKGELFVPMGRPRLVEKNGRERRLDDNLTAVRPVWSPDSAKVAAAFNTQVRIYDAIGDAPTQAAIPLRNQLLIASKEYEEKLQTRNPNENTNTEANSQPNANANINANQTANTTPNQPIGTLPDESSLSSFNPVINLEWTQDSMLYLQTGYVKDYKNAVENRRSFLRWHRLIFSPQAVALQ
ncbi:MAG: hypothetical protein ACR2MG_03160 [Pyrinomonadaceae bacterium]